MYVTLDKAITMGQSTLDKAFNDFMNKYYNDPYFKSRGKSFELEKPYVVWKKKGFGVAGTAFPSMGKIEMNINYLYSVDAINFIHNTMIHELAHIINGYYGGRNHDHQWKYIARLLGDDAERCHNYKAPDNKPLKNRKSIKCTGCGYVYEVTDYRYRNYKKYICRKCKSHLIQI